MTKSSTVHDRNGQGIQEQIIARFIPRHSTAAVLFHQAIAERLGLGPTDMQCLHLLRERGPMTGGKLATITGLTSGAITGVVARLETSGYLRRTPDKHDQRKQNLMTVMEKGPEIAAVFAPIRKDMAALLASFDSRQLGAVAEFLSSTTGFIYHHLALLRAPEVMALDTVSGSASAEARVTRSQHSKRKAQSRSASLKAQPGKKKAKST